MNAVTLRFAYGLDAHDMDDPLVELTELANEQFARASIPGAFLVDTLPFCTSQTLVVVERLFKLSFALCSAICSGLVSGDWLETART